MEDGSVGLVWDFLENSDCCIQEGELGGGRKRGLGMLFGGGGKGGTLHLLPFSLSHLLIAWHPNLIISTFCGLYNNFSNLLFPPSPLSSFSSHLSSLHLSSSLLSLSLTCASSVRWLVVQTVGGLGGAWSERMTCPKAPCAPSQQLEVRQGRQENACLGLQRLPTSDPQLLCLGWVPMHSSF